MSRGLAVALWLALLGVGFGLAPPTRPDVGALVGDLLFGRFDGHPTWQAAEFQAMGLWPALVGLLVRAEWRARVPAWPFVLASFGLGCYALLPWFALRSGDRPEPEPGPFGRADLPAALAIGALGLASWAAAEGVAGASALAHEIRTDGFTWAMTWDFAAFWLVGALEARARTRGAPWALALVPLVGLGAFLALEERRRRR